MPKDPVFSTKSVIQAQRYHWLPLQIQRGASFHQAVLLGEMGDAVKGTGQKKALGAKHWPGWGRK